MEIGGFEHLSLIDYPGRLASVVFTIGCNFRCWFCQNGSLVRKEYAKLDMHSTEGVLKKIEESRRMIEGVAITGGEPTLHADLPEFMERIKGMNLGVKLDTNGSNPKMLHHLVERKLVDYIAMDVKMPVKRYAEAIMAKGFEARINESIALIISSGIDHEFRTTVTPQLFPDDILEIAKEIKGAQAFSLQKFNPANTLSAYSGNSYEWSDAALIEQSKKINELGIIGKCEVKNL